MCKDGLPGPRVSELLHSMLHEISGPAGQIHRLAALIEQSNDGLVGETRRWLLHLRTAAEHLGESMAAIRRYAEIFEYPQQPARFFLSDAVAAAQESAAPEIALSGTCLPQIEADRRRIELLFRELLSNAWKFRSDARPAVQISAAREGESVVVSIADNGIGIDPRHAERIFLPFVRLSGDRSTGAGIGLTVARTIVEMWGGRIWVGASTGPGATFQFTLPDDALSKTNSRQQGSMRLGQDVET